MIFYLNHTQARARAVEAVRTAPAGWVVRVTEPTRNLEQNALLWAALTEVANQVVWHGSKLSPDEWKSVFTAALKRQKVVPGIDGGFVVCALSTSSMSKSTFSDLLEIIFAFGAEHGVQFQDSTISER